MKVLLLFPMADGQTGPAIKYAFEKLGHVVKAVDAKTRLEFSYLAACEFKPDLVFCSRTYQLVNQIVGIKREMNTTICMWNVDTRTRIEEWSHLFPLIKLCDYHFIVDTKTIPEWRKLNQNTFWLPQGLQDEVYMKPKEITAADKEKYECDVSWAGTRTGVHGFRGKFLDAVERMGVKFKQWGCNENPRICDEEHNKMVYLSKINLCCSGWPENGKYTSVRNYKILGAGGFLLEYYRDGLYDVFHPDVFNSYEDIDDLKYNIEYWLEFERIRKDVAKQGYDWVHSQATYTHRIRMALEYMK